MRVFWLLVVVRVATALDVEVRASGEAATPNAFSVDDLIGVLSPPEALDLGAALAMVGTPVNNKRALARASVPTSITTATPLLHYLFGLLPRLAHHNPSREAFGTLFSRLLELGVDPNRHPSNLKEPSLLFKAVFMREVKLSLAILQAGGRPAFGATSNSSSAPSASSTTTTTAATTAKKKKKRPARDPDSVLGKLVGAPCDIVPFSKLLLHADTMLSDPTWDAKFAGPEGRRRFVASASRASGSKPLPHSDELFALSATYRSLVGALGNLHPVEGLPVNGVVGSVGEAVASVVKQLLRAAGASEAFAEDIKRADASGRTPLHSMAAAGSPAVIRVVEDFVRRSSADAAATAEAATVNTAVSSSSSLASGDDDDDDDEKKKEQKKEAAATASSVREAVVTALSTKDVRGFTPLDVALVSWGNAGAGSGGGGGGGGAYGGGDGAVALALRSLAASAGAEYPLPSSVLPAGTSKAAQVAALRKELPAALAAALLPFTENLDGDGDDDDDGDDSHPHFPSQHGRPLMTETPVSKVESAAAAAARAAATAATADDDSGGGSSRLVLDDTGGWDYDTTWTALTTARPSSPTATSSSSSSSSSSPSSPPPSSASSSPPPPPSSSPPPQRTPSALRERCDVVELQWSREVAEAFQDGSALFTHFLSRGVPLVLRSAAVGQALQTHFAKKAFLERYGSHVVPVSGIPYSDSFGVPSQPKTLAQVANSTTPASLLSPPSSSSSSPSFSSTSHGVDYAFSTPQNDGTPSGGVGVGGEEGKAGGGGWAAKVAHDAPPPSWLQNLLSNFSEASYETQFYLGPPGSGAPVHFHGHAVNVLAFGSKKWFLSPPSRARYSKASAADRFLASSSFSSSRTSARTSVAVAGASNNSATATTATATTATTAERGGSAAAGGSSSNGNGNDNGNGGNEDSSEVRELPGEGGFGALECTQHAGDVVVLPTLWGHGTRNERQSIGVAYELSLEPFCME